MLYTKPLKKSDFKTKSAAFSLIEILLTLFIVTIVLAILAPAITKKLKPTEAAGVVYTYDGNNIEYDPSEKKCMDATGARTNECSEYVFTVPEGVRNVNLTLVAGGGGGGGAAGGTLNEYKNGIEASSAANEFTPNDLRERYRSIKIDYMTGRGQNGYKVVDDSGLSSSYFADANNYYFPPIYLNSENDIRIKHGRGGASSGAIYNYEIPKEYFRITYKNPLSITDRITHKVEVSNLDLSDSNYINGLKSPQYTRYFIYPTSNNYYMYRTGPTVGGYYVGEHQPYYGTGGSPSTDDCSNAANDHFDEVGQYGAIACYKDAVSGVNNLCSIQVPKENYILPILGSVQDYLLKQNADTFTPNKNFGYIQGDAGGVLPMYSEYGAGGKGQDVICEEPSSGNGNLANSKAASCHNGAYSNVKMQCDAVGNPEAGKTGIFKGSYTIEEPAQTGAGGMAGGVLKINNFPVEPGQTYVIRVGKGGSGGAAGKYGKTVYYENSTTSIKEQTNATNGADGKNGVSTSIWQRNENGSETLVYFISGGRGGNGGNQSNAPGSIVATNANHSVAEAGNEAYFNYTDTNVSAAIDPGAGCNHSSYISSGNLSRCVLYNMFDTSKSNLPYVFLNANGDTSTNTCSANAYGCKSRSFSDYKLSADPSVEGTVSIGGTNYLTGFYYRSVTKNGIGYVGGNGAFSGLGGKAGCGGLFMGNQNGFNGNANDPNYNPSQAKKFFINSNSYSIYDYYDNCTVDNPNGQSANFVLPDPVRKTYGQAGAGGGGGGYTMFEGAGKGGNGQDGYLMIDWRK